MPINKDLSVSPYFDDFDEEKNYYKVLFKPGVSVQVRELNQLQTILQAQIEKFGNNIYKRGTIIDGVNFIYHENYAYAKIKDSQLDGMPAVPDMYVGNFVVDPTTNLTAHVINSEDGFESTDPNLKTIYVRYINSGDDGDQNEFESDAVLTVYDYLDSINRVSIINGSSGFSNTDSVVFCSAIAVNVSSNTGFTVGETISQTGNNNFAIITAIETVQNKHVLKIRPRSADLTNTAIASNTWVFTPGEGIIGGTSGATASVDESIGNSAVAIITTSADIGKINEIDVSSRGEGYYVAPYVTVKSSGVASAVGPRNYNDLNLVAWNYMAQITVSDVANSVGFGYAFSVTEGVIYQKGYFSRVHPQTIIVDKYSNSPNQLAVGFDTEESVIDSNFDQDLLDNATGTRNQYAPGADRLKLEPILVVLTADEASANDEFLSIVEFSEGRAFRENKRTQFNSIMDEMALRTNEQSGNFVLDQFLVTTRSTSNQSNEGELFSVVTDPGRGYINGYRVETTANYSVDIDKGTDSKEVTDLSSTIDYGNYIRINEVAGMIDTNTGATVNLIANAVHYVSNTTLVTGGTITSGGGTTIGTAKMRNIVYETGLVGTGSAIYRMYLFDIRMNTSKNFSDVRGVRSSTDAVADVVLTFDATLNANTCKMYDKNEGTSLLVYTGTDAAKTIDSLTYVYRNVNPSMSIANNGTTSYLLPGADDYYAYTSDSLTDNEKKTVMLVPTGNNVVLTANTTSDGTANVATASNSASLSSTATINSFNVGDFIAFFSSSSVYTIRRVTGKTANTIQVDSTIGFTNTTASFSRAFPKHVPIPLDRVPGATVTLSGGAKTMNIFLGRTHFGTAAVTASLTFDVETRNISAQAKTADRDNFVKLDLSTAGTSGPWCLGIPDAFRLKGVYLSNSSSVSTSSTDVTDQFFIDHNQTPDYYGLSYLYKRNDANITLTSGSWLLVQFDAFTSSAGVYTINSYVSANTAQRFADDSLSLASLGTKTNSFEIPELVTADGRYYDLINYIDFRPVAANTVAYAKSAAVANTNPSSTLVFSGANKKFPLPESAVQYDRESFLGRKDSVVITSDNLIKVVRGVPSDDQPYSDAKTPPNTLLLNKVVIPSYPCIPQKVSSTTAAILNRKLSNERILRQRLRNRTIKTESNDQDISINQPKAFTMADINNLERRITDLEYNVALSLVENDLKDRVIPSDVSPGINRFKFGFFVDDYTSKKNSDIDNVEYQADVIDSMVSPVSESLLLTHGQGYRLGEWDSEYTLINQDLASEVPPLPVTPPPAPVLPPPVVTPPTANGTPTPSPSPVVPTPPPVVPVREPTPAPSPTTPTTVVTTRTTSVYRSYRNSTYKKMDILNVRMSSLASTYKIVYDFDDDIDELKIYKGSTLVATYNINRTGTITLNHNPSTGRDYKFVVNEKSKKWQYTLTYPVDSTVVVPSSPPSTTINNVAFDGHLVEIVPGYMSATNANQNFGEVAYLTQGGRVRVRVAGLKPLTRHTVTAGSGGVSLTATPIVGAVGAPISGNPTGMISNSSGGLEFYLNVDPLIMTPAVIENLINEGYSTIPSTLLVRVASANDNSVAHFYISTMSEQFQNITRAVAIRNSYVMGGVFDPAIVANFGWVV